MIISPRDGYNSYLKSEPFSTFVKGLERLEESIINLSELDFLVENVQKTLFLIDETFIKSYEELDLKFDSLIVNVNNFCNQFLKVYILLNL